MSLDEFLDLRGRDRRIARLTHDVVLPVASGLVLGGPDPAIALPDSFQVEFVADPLDGPAGGGRGGGGNDFAIGANVVQNARNPMAWYDSVYEMLRPGGVLNLSIPDRRRVAPRDAWVYTPSSFLDFIEGATRVGTFRFVISQFASTEPGEAEFYVCLRRDAEADDARRRNLQLFAISYVRRLAEQRER